MKKGIFVMALITTVVLGIFVYIKNNKSIDVVSDIVEESKYIQDVEESIDIDENKEVITLEQINKIIEEATDEQVILKVRNQDIAKCDIEEMGKVLNIMSDQGIVNKDNVINETIKQAVVVEEAKENGYSISEEQLDTFKTIAKNMYESSDKTLSKEVYTSKWLRIQENEELAFRYKSYILLQISQGEFKPLNDETSKKLDIFNKEKNVSNLDAIYDSHINFLSKDYLIK